jgi:hypothetical protein
MEPPDALHSFHRSLYECLYRRGDTLFELIDAIFDTDTAAPSPVHLSLQPSHRRGWGSLYAALGRGRIDAEALRYPEQADRWTWLVLAAFTQLRLARACVADLRLPWDATTTQLTWRRPGFTA